MRSLSFLVFHRGAFTSARHAALLLTTQYGSSPTLPHTHVQLGTSQSHPPTGRYKLLITHTCPPDGKRICCGLPTALFMKMPVQLCMPAIAIVRYANMKLLDAAKAHYLHQEQGQGQGQDKQVRAPQGVWLNVSVDGQGPAPV